MFLKTFYSHTSEKKTQLILKATVLGNKTGISITVTRKRISWKQYGKAQ